MNNQVFGSKITIPVKLYRLFTFWYYVYELLSKCPYLENYINMSSLSPSSQLDCPMVTCNILLPHFLVCGLGILNMFIIYPYAPNACDFV